MIQKKRKIEETKMGKLDAGHCSAPVRGLEIEKRHNGRMLVGAESGAGRTEEKSGRKGGIDMNMCYNATSRGSMARGGNDTGGEAVDGEGGGRGSSGGDAIKDSLSQPQRGDRVVANASGSAGGGGKGNGKADKGSGDMGQDDVEVDAANDAGSLYLVHLELPCLRFTDDLADDGQYEVRIIMVLQMVETTSCVTSQILPVLCLCIHLDLRGISRGGGLGSRPIFKKFHETYAPS